MCYKQTPVKTTGNELAAGCRVFYRKIYRWFLQCMGQYVISLEKDRSERISIIAHLITR